MDIGHKIFQGLCVTSRTLASLRVSSLNTLGTSMTRSKSSGHEPGTTTAVTNGAGYRSSERLATKLLEVSSLTTRNPSITDSRFALS
jgi:hypothetical protein